MNIVDENGYYIGGIPDEAVNDCSHSGECGSDITYWVDKLSITFPRKLMESYLKEFGAWDDLATAPDSTLIERCFWCACCDLNESGDWFGLVH